jgi:C4-dicarboxylate-binding protein DctP
MKSAVFIRGAQYFCVLMASLLLAPFPVKAQQTKLRITLQLPIAGHLGVNLVRFKEEVGSRTEGAVTLEIFDNSRLYKDNEALGAVASGSIEMATITYQQLTKQVPAIGILEQPFLFNFEALVRAAIRPDGEMRMLLDKAVLDATSVRILWWQSYGSSVLFSKGRHAKHPLQIRGQKVRVFGENMVHFTKACGGVPMLISASKQYQAVKDGTVDLVMTGITGVDTRELWKVTDTITRTEHAALEFVVIINEKVWQSLPQSHRTAIAEASRKVEKELREQMADIEAKAYAFARAKGMTIQGLSPDDVAEWRACSVGLLEDYMNDAGELGWRLLSAYGRLRMEPCCSAGPAGAFNLR